MAGPIGRPTKYKPEYCEQATKLCLLGATDEDLARFFNVANSTIYEWMNEHPDFSESIKDGRLGADANVAKSLYQRAIGYSHKAVKIFYNSHHGHTVEHEYIEHYPPEATACFFWLKNRRSDLWRDNPAKAIEDEAQKAKNMTNEQLAEVLEKQAQELRAAAPNLKVAK